MSTKLMLTDVTITTATFGAVLVAGGSDLDLLRVRWAFADDGWATLWHTR